MEAFMKKTILCTLGIMAMFGFSSCTSSKISEEPKEVKTVETENEKPKGVIGNVQIPNPFFTCNSLEEAAEIAGFSINLPAKEDLPDWTNEIIYRATKENLLEIIYPEDDTFEREIRLRKAISDKDDISGDFRSYDKECELIISEKTVNVKMNKDIIYIVTWEDGIYKYSARVSDGMKKEECEKIISVIK